MTGAFRINSTYIAQGEQAVGASPDAVITTTLGSCVAVCLWDPAGQVGGMNHILLPDDPGSWSQINNLGGTAMDRLMNALVKTGADRARLRAKVFGGAAMIAGLSDIGERNAAFVLEYLARETIPCDAKSVGGRAARQVKFWPHEGRVQQRFVSGFKEPEHTPSVARTNGVELF
ncbi:MAG: chemotaxis protein CheD [Paracoccaceae bacterium]|nr:chemotaxis protein CheD [Paracoccaceae bacterium]